MSSLASCHRCQGFLADVTRACPHCDATPGRWRVLARALTATVIGAVSMTLMACYGAMPEPSQCYGQPEDCDCQYYGDCDECYADSECFQGEYCRDDGFSPTTCEWGGTCSDDLQCPFDMVCDPARGTCRPGIREGCDAHSDCVIPGERCDFPSRTCVPTTACGTGLPGCDEGSSCDATYEICVPCVGDACGTCTAELLCTEEPPACAEDAHPAIDDTGCFTGGCITDATCAAQACAALDEPACDASATCNPVYGGVNCSSPDGSPCSGGASCTCESFIYLDCVVAPPAPPPQPRM